MAGSKVQTSKVWKCAIFPDVARFSVETGCKLQVIFRKKATHYRALLQKMTCKDKRCYGSWPPCTCMTFHRDTSMTCQKWWGVVIHLWPCLTCHRWMVDIRDTFNFMSLNESQWFICDTWDMVIDVWRHLFISDTSYMYLDVSQLHESLSWHRCRDGSTLSCMNLVMHACRDTCMSTLAKDQSLIFAIHSRQWVCIVYI